MSEELKEKLRKLSKEQLVDLIIELSDETELSLGKIERVIARPKENASRFLQRLKNIKSRKEFVFRSDASSFSHELVDILKDLASSNPSGEEGYKLICKFYEMDKWILDQCDDSDGLISGVFRWDAFELYAKFSKSHPDRELVLKKNFELVSKDEYAARQELVLKAIDFLNHGELRQLFDLILTSEPPKDREYATRWKLSAIAKQLGDAPLFEKVHLNGIANPNGRLLVDVAEVYFDSGNLEKAQEILDSINQGDTFSKFEKESLQKKIFLKQGNMKDLFNIIRNAFLSSPNEHTLKELKAVTDETDLKSLVEEAQRRIGDDLSWNVENANFLKHIGQFTDLSVYVLNRRERIDGTYYYELPELAEALIKNKQYLAAVVLLRALIDGVLIRSVSKYYHHAVRYLNKLDLLEGLVLDWGGLKTHQEYLTTLKVNHRLKKSFWSKYEQTA